MRCPGTWPWQNSNCVYSLHCVYLVYLVYLVFLVYKLHVLSGVDSRETK